MAKSAIVEANGHHTTTANNQCNNNATPKDPAIGPAQPENHKVLFLNLRYRGDDTETSNASATALIHKLRPDWGSDIDFRRFTDGITNTLLQARPRHAEPLPGESQDDARDREAILLRAYGNGTDLIIDRNREAQNHELLSRHRLAPELLALFENGMLYRFIRGRVTAPQDLRRPEIYRAVARRLAQWHSTIPCLPMPKKQQQAQNITNGSQSRIDEMVPGKLQPNIWTVMQKWILALPTETNAQRERQASLQKELDRVVAEFAQRPGLGHDGLVFAHCDLLSGNVIVLPKPAVAAKSPATATSTDVSVTFIDYEYATPSPAAFDLANHFAEWGGFDCDFSVLPTRAQRREFIREYIRVYFGNGGSDEDDHEEDVEDLFAEVDVYRGLPGFYWGIWALIQATISTIDFDYASYAETRLGEYWAWRAEQDGSRAREGREMPLRERRWAQEE
ncbi:hypothetical protein MCOR25_002092 [Pyricularia grisea]|uniref:ethanolamine kinase n=1 Tax=Pyricularia grisea TaxID=148305 RepID=A0A6P8B9K8_PYRGI|nr:uncharacterized protein PgNI_03171 [Pyricularia grisea]KAI6379112.1 hypothetical protein MCOR25_002092 [Pyricularia grisea]TLD12505.1 hypothetical protein PgNI_03171 [Pyricularia grisea]